LIINLIDPSIEEVNEIIMEGDISIKTTMLNLYGLSMKSSVKIMNDGRLSKEDMKMLRILFGVRERG
jgi:hypothetical protein